MARSMRVFTDLCLGERRLIWTHKTVRELAPRPGGACFAHAGCRTDLSAAGGTSTASWHRARARGPGECPYKAAQACTVVQRLFASLLGQVEPVPHELHAQHPPSPTAGRPHSPLGWGRTTEHNSCHGMIVSIVLMNTSRFVGRQNRSNPVSVARGPDQRIRAACGGLFSA